MTIRVTEKKVGKSDIVSVFMDIDLGNILSSFTVFSEEWDNLSSTDNPQSFKLMSVHGVVNEGKVDDDNSTSTQGNWEAWLGIGVNAYSVTNIPSDITAEGVVLGTKFVKKLKNETVMATQELFIDDGRIENSPIIAPKIYVGYSSLGNANWVQDLKLVMKFERKKVTENVYLKALVSGC